MSGRHAGGRSSGGDLTARVRAASALRADFEREMRSSQLDEVDRNWLGWAARLSAAMSTVLDVLNGPQPAVTVRFPDGSAFLTSQDTEALTGVVRRLGGVQ